MAITVYTKDEVKFLWGEQATWGTALADTADFNGTTPEWGEILDCEIVSMDWDAKTREPNRSNVGARVTASTNRSNDTNGSTPKIQIVGDAKKKTLASMLYAVMQNVSEAAGSPFEKTYTFSATQPDFTAGAGWFGTFIVNQGSSQSQKISDVIVNELVLTCNPDDGQGRMQMTASCMGRGPVTTNSNPNTGVLAKYSQDFYAFHAIKTCTIEGNAIVPLGLTITIKNNAIPVGVDLSNAGKFLTYALPSYEVDVALRCVWDTNSYTFQAVQDDAQTQSQLILTWGTDNNDGYLTFNMYGQVLPSPDIYDPVKGIELKMKAVYDGTNAPLTVVLADAIDRGW